MACTVYHINKGVNRPLTFRGLRAQYIGFLAGGLVALLLLFAGMYLVGLGLLACTGTIAVAGALLFAGVYHLSNTYGEHGLLKRLARRSIPQRVRLRSRKAFTSLTSPHDTGKEAARGTAH